MTCHVSIDEWQRKQMKKCTKVIPVWRSEHWSWISAYPRLETASKYTMLRSSEKLKHIGILPFDDRYILRSISNLVYRDMYTNHGLLSTYILFSTESTRKTPLRKSCKYQLWGFWTFAQPPRTLNHIYNTIKATIFLITTYVTAVKSIIINTIKFWK